MPVRGTGSWVFGVACGIVGMWIYGRYTSTPGR